MIRELIENSIGISSHHLNRKIQISISIVNVKFDPCYFCCSVTIAVNSLCICTYIGERDEEKDRQREYDVVLSVTMSG
jgi:hypothetical protein